MAIPGVAGRSANGRRVLMLDDGTRNPAATAELGALALSGAWLATAQILYLVGPYLYRWARCQRTLTAFETPMGRLLGWPAVGAEVPGWGVGVYLGQRADAYVALPACRAGAVRAFFRLPESVPLARFRNGLLSPHFLLGRGEAGL